MPKWLKIVIEAAVKFLKDEGHISPNAQRKPGAELGEKGKAWKLFDKREDDRK